VYIHLALRIAYRENSTSIMPPIFLSIPEQSHFACAPKFRDYK